MRLIRDLVPGYPESNGAVVTIGNFDGVHLGHQAVIDQVRELANRHDLVPTVVCFEPMPREYFSAAAAPARLTRLRRKFRLIAGRAIERLVCLRFNEFMAGMSAANFVDDILCRALDTRHVIVGEDFRFGRNRGGDIGMLRTRAAKAGFEVVAATTFVIRGERVSSTGVRLALAEGNLEVAAELLGGPYTLEGHVRHGEKIGRKLGFPTANVHTGPYRLPLRGVFAGMVTLANGAKVKAAVNIGTRPVLGKAGEELLEVHLLDFDDDIYGQRLEVSLLKKLRDEKEFDGLDALRVQIASDVQQVRVMLQ